MSEQKDGYCWCDMCGFNAKLPAKFRAEVEGSYDCPWCKKAGAVISLLCVGDELEEHVIPDDPMMTWPQTDPRRGPVRAVSKMARNKVADWTVRMGDEAEEEPEIRTFSEATGVTTTFDEPLVSSEEWRWNIINEGLSNIWCGNEFLGCCATLEAKKICETHNASFGAREAKRRARPGNSVPSDFYQPDDLHNHRCSMDHPPCPACQLTPRTPVGQPTAQDLINNRAK